MNESNSMYQIKIFINNMSQIEKEINWFLAQFDEEDIIDIKFMNQNHGMYNAVVTYRVEV